LREANRAEVNLLEDPEFRGVLDGQMKKQLEIAPSHDFLFTLRAMQVTV